MEFFSPRQLEQLGVTPPPRFNDDQRVDMRDGGPFLAIDPKRPAEIDDAIRARRLPEGGYIVETAIADAAQLVTERDIVERAIDRRWNLYGFGGFATRRIVSPRVVKELQLSRGERRALVVSRRYSEDLEAGDDVEVTPATIEAVTISSPAFGIQSAKAEAKQRKHSALRGFNYAYRQHHELPRLSPLEVPKNDKGLYSRRLVETYMVLANAAVAHWAQQRGIALLFRNFDKSMTGVSELSEVDEIVHGSYATDPQTHHGLSHVLPEAAQSYTHVTSPLRRAVDLVNHLQIGTHIAELDLPFDQDQLGVLADHFNAVRSRTSEPVPAG